MIHLIKGYCTVCKADKTLYLLILNCFRPKKRKALLAEVDKNMVDKNMVDKNMVNKNMIDRNMEVVKEGLPTKKR